jgi:hypothetical protein
MVLHRPVEPAGVIGQVEASTNMDGYLVNRELRPIRVSRVSNLYRIPGVQKLRFDTCP